MARLSSAGVEAASRDGGAVSVVPSDTTRSLDLWTRVGLLALPVYGLLTGWATLTHQPSAQDDFPAYARYITTPEFLAGHLVGSIGGTILAIYGVMALFGYLARRRGAGTALAGLLTSVAGNVLVVALFGVAAFAAPPLGRAFLAGNTSMADLNSAIYSAPLGLTGLLGTLLYSLGAILFGVAIWRSGALPKATGILYALAGPLISVFGLFIGPAQTLGAALLIIASVWIAWYAWRQP